MNEFCIEWIKGNDYAGVTVPSGTAFFRIPISYVKASPPRKVSDEQKEAAGERFRKIREEKKGLEG